MIKIIKMLFIYLINIIYFFIYVIYIYKIIIINFLIYKIKILIKNKFLFE